MIEDNCIYLKAMNDFILNDCVYFDKEHNAYPLSIEKCLTDENNKCIVVVDKVKKGECFWARKIDWVQGTDK